MGAYNSLLESRFLMFEAIVSEIVFTAPEEVLQVSRLRLQTPPLRYILRKKKKNGGKIEKRKEEKNN